MTIKLVVPASREELLSHDKDIVFLTQFLPYQADIGAELIRDNILNRAPLISLFFWQTTRYRHVLAMCQVEASEFNPRWVEIHGVIRQDLKPFLPRRNELSRRIAPLLFAYLFLICGVEGIVICEEDENKAVSVFARHWRFEALTQSPKRYLLTRARYKQLLCRY